MNSKFLIILLNAIPLILVFLKAKANCESFSSISSMFNLIEISQEVVNVTDIFLNENNLHNENTTK
jgi:hypothetical protein